MVWRGDEDGLPTSIHREVHKGLRFALSAVLNVAATSTAHPDSLEQLGRAWRDVSQLLAMHRRQQTAFVDPVLARHAPQHRIRLAEANAAIATATQRLDRAVPDILEAPPEQQSALLEQVYLDVARLISLSFGHFHDEELDVMRSLRHSLGPDQLEMFRVELRNDIAPAEMETLLRSMMPALSLAERVDVLDELQRSTSLEGFEGYRAAVETALEPSAYRDVAQALRLR